MKTISGTQEYAADQISVFDCLDELSVTGLHLTERSMAMIGGKMNLEFISHNKTDGIKVPDGLVKCCGCHLTLPFVEREVKKTWKL